MATPKKSAGKKSTAKKSTAKKAPAKATTKKTTEPSVRSAAEKARGAAGDISVVMASRVKDVLKQVNMRVDSDVANELNRRVQDLLTRAADRAKSNKRKTVRPHDL